MGEDERPPTKPRIDPGVLFATATAVCGTVWLISVVLIVFEGWPEQLADTARGGFITFAVLGFINRGLNRLADHVDRRIDKKTMEYAVGFAEGLQRRPLPEESPGLRSIR